ncbi:hypothetical protein CAOG_01752 [Capsaspora owczarzaki ATCC 30864]|uniref:hypothetical protein n=1 Tax=Capsaspora owczarzaki (strain ATCC 30864) TaxID=595528 RepID=UPI0001FE36B5|nr:hypothetical protein CAOG_01752 [Capsaspora owczarzaki ATCC 30864]|eukprot:XP_004364620.1 hypothetical protein CAOG_01752 [Capsaspora owczarzaki ATCC 30864]
MTALSSFLTRHKVVTDTVICSSLYSTGDIIQQRIEGVEGWDWRRTARMGSVGMFLGPCNHYWYRMIDSKFPTAVNFKQVTVKVLCDHFYTGMALMHGNSMAEYKKELVDKYPHTFMVDCMVWPGLQYVNFFFVKGPFRVAYVASCSLFWNIFLSHMKHAYNSDESHAPSSAATLATPQTTESLDVAAANRISGTASALVVAATAAAAGPQPLTITSSPFEQQMRLRDALRDTLRTHTSSLQFADAAIKNVGTALPSRLLLNRLAPWTEFQS